MKLSRIKLRKLILHEIKLLQESSAGGEYSVNAGGSRGNYYFKYVSTGDTTTVTKASHNGKPIKKEFFGDQAGLFTDSQGLKIAKNALKTHLKNKNHPTNIEYDF